MNRLVFCLMGPTASGKTDLAGELVSQFPFEVVSVDSVMIYRELDIGSAKPDNDFLGRVPHQLINIIDPSQSYSAAQFCKDTQLICREIYSRGNLPLLVGGTMMYFNALQQGMSELPEASPSIRASLLEQAKKYGWEYLHKELAKVDPKTAERLHPNDTQRIQRALEVYQLTKQPLSVLQQRQNIPNEHEFINLALVPANRSWLHDRIALRFRQMLDDGLVSEVEALEKKWQLLPEHPSMRCVGYRQVLAHLHGAYDYEQMYTNGVVATRQLAKRQLTWLRNWHEVQNFSAEDPSLTKAIIDKVQRILDNTLF